jgi:tripartite-type tricarboxylate transporter receptor subunit TctC
MKCQTSFQAAVLAGLTCVLGNGLASAAENTPAFYKNKTVTIQVGFDRGSDYDRYARALGRHMGRHIPGHPVIRTENSPGEDSLRLANLMYHFLPQDGTIIATIAPRLATEKMSSDSAAKFDGDKFQWLGSMNNDVAVCAVWHTTPIFFWQDLIDRQTVMGGTEPAALSQKTPLVLNNVFSTRIRLITGYPNDTYLNAALTRGDLDGRCGWPISGLKSAGNNWLASKQIKILVQMSMEKHPRLPNVPLVLDFARSKRDLQILKWVFGARLWAQPYLVGPRVPPARVQILREAFSRTMADPKFISDIKGKQLDLAWVNGVKIQKAIADLSKTPADLIAAAKILSTRQSNTQISRAVIPTKSSDGTITAIQEDGRAIFWEGAGGKGKIAIKGGRTKILVDGLKVGLRDLKPGMSCLFSYRVATARRITCR